MVLNQLSHHCTLNHSPTHNILSEFIPKTYHLEYFRVEKKTLSEPLSLSTVWKLYRLFLSILLKPFKISSQLLYHRRCISCITDPHHVAQSSIELEKKWQMNEILSTFPLFQIRMLILYYVNPSKPLDGVWRMKANNSMEVGQVLNHSCHVVAASLSSHPKLLWPKGNSPTLSSLCENLLLLSLISPRLKEYY